jgi:transcriptional regulator with GAF, ATPase, and Fis domain
MQVQIEALRRAASALLEAATDHTTLRTVLRALIDEPPDEPLRSNGDAIHAATHSQHSAQKPQPAPAEKPTRAKQATTDAPVDAAWLTLRTEVRDAMRERGITTEAIAGQLGVSRITVTVSLNRRTPPTKRMQQRLAEWLSRGAVAVPEVTAAAASFRPNGHAGRSTD